MKPQDVLFVLVLISILISRRMKLALYAGMLCLILAIPLFSAWIFFTAERLTWYAAAFFTAFLLISIVKPNAVQ